MSNNILNDISAVYIAEVLEPKIKAGGDGSSKKVEKGGTSEEASAKRIRQAVYDIRYRAKREDIELAQAFNQYTGKSSMTGQEKSAVKEKLGLAEEVEEIQEVENQKFQVRVRDKESGKTYVRYATREKISQLRSNPNISSVEMTKYGKPYEGERERGEYTSKVKAGKGLDPVGREDKDIDNDGDHDKTDKYLLKRRKAIGKAIATRKEEFHSWRDSLTEIADELDDKKKKIKEKNVQNKININPMMGESVQKLGGELLETEEFIGIFSDVVDVDYYHIDDKLIEQTLVEFYEEIKEEYDLLEVRKAIIEEINIEIAILNEASVTYGHDTDTTNLKQTKMEKMKSAVKKAYTKGKTAYDSKEGKRVRKKIKKGLYRVAKRISNVADRGMQRLMNVGEAITQMPGRETTPPAGTTAQQDDIQIKQKDDALRKQMLARKKQMMMKQQTIDRQRLQAQQQGKLPIGNRTEEVEQVDEKLNLKKAEMGEVIKDFYKSKAPQFKGFSKEKRREMAVAAKLTAERGGRKLGEQMSGAPQTQTPQTTPASPNPAMAKKKEMMDNQKLANLNMIQQKRQQLERQRMQMQKAGKLPLETASYQPEGEVIDERRREDKGTPRGPEPSAAYKAVSKMMGSGRLGVQPRGVKKDKGAPTSEPSMTPAQKVAKRRADAQRAQDMMHSRYD